MVQTGDPTGTGTGGPGYTFKDEPVKQRYTQGTVAMANSGPNTNGSQFFIVVGKKVSLPPNYTIFGKVKSGMSVVLKIANTPVGPSPANPQEVSSPRKKVKMIRVTIHESK
jgi:cyclophilin family peptidyl-prolyl cis-trans isomerase